MPSAGSDFGAHGGGLSVLSKYSSALVVADADVPTERLKSVPSPWARLLIFEQALFSSGHPAHSRIVNEWRGLLGCIGLSRYLGLQIECRQVGTAQGHGVLRNLRAMAPADSGADGWDRLALIYADGELVGGTSPRTLVFTGIRPGHTGRTPFSREGRLTDPVIYYAELGDRAAVGLMVAWIDHTAEALRAQQADLRQMMGSSPTGVDAQPLSRADALLEQLAAWSKDAHRACEAVQCAGAEVVRGYVVSPLSAAFPSDHPASRVFRRIECVEAADAIGTRNDLAIHGLDGVVFPGKGGRIERGGQPYSGNVLLPKGMTRHVRAGYFDQSTSAMDVGATLPDLGTLFADNIIPLSGVNVGAARGLEVAGGRYLYPFTSSVLEHIPPNVLAEWVKATGEPANEVRVTLSIPLQSGLSVVYERTYTSSEIVRDSSVAMPLLTEWPDFEASSWKHYFYHLRYATRTGIPLLLAPYNVHVAESFADEGAGVSWGCSTEPPRAWLGHYGQHTGILVTKPRATAKNQTSSWDVSVDFGSTHTRVFAAYEVDGRRCVEEVRLERHTRGMLGEDHQLAFHFFGGQEADGGGNAEPPSLIWLPLGRVLQHAWGKAWLPNDGIIYWGTLQDVPNVDGLRGNLKWHSDALDELGPFRSYIAQVYLEVAAEAAVHGATVKSLTTAYPSVLPKPLRHRHEQEWREVARRFDIASLTIRSESDGVASFFVEEEAAAVATNLLALDVGGSTADLAVWVASERTYSDSVRVAGDILSRLIAADPNAREAVTRAVQRPPFNFSGIVWDDKNGGRNGLIFNSLLREISRNPEFQRMPATLAKNLCDGAGTQGERLIAHLAYLFALTSFYLGMAVRKVGLQADRLDIRFAGKGSEYLHWLEALATGASRTLPATFFRAGAQITAGDVQITPPGSKAKQEVGRGLLSNRLPPPAEGDERVTMVGENGFTGGAQSWADDLSFDVLRRMKVPETPRAIESLEHLAAFLATFQHDPAAKKAARALGLEERGGGVELRDAIHDRLFGPKSVWKSAQRSGPDQEKKALEPFFIVEAKVLLEYSTGNRGLFEE